MSLKDRFANHSENAAEQPQPEEQKSVELYDTPGHARNICFVQADGEAVFLNYAYLVSCKFLPSKSIIQLFFTTHSVEIKGQDLRNLFKSIFNQTAHSIFVIEERYVATKEKKDVVVTSILITASKE